MESVASSSSSDTLDVTIDSSASTNISNDSTLRILGEIVGATNLAAALMTADERVSKKRKRRLVNAYCHIYLGDKIIHKTMSVRKNNNPIWACDSGSLFLLDPSMASSSDHLRIEVYDLVKKHRSKLIGIVKIPMREIKYGNMCDERRLQFEVKRDGEECMHEIEQDKSIFSTGKNIFKQVSQLVNAESLRMGFTLNREVLHDEDSVDSEHNSHEDKSFETKGIDDNYIFGEKGTLAIRFRVATPDDIKFIKAIEKYNSVFERAKQKAVFFRSTGMKKFLENKSLAHLATETSTKYIDIVNCETIHELIDYRMLGQFFDNSGVKKLRVKPYTDPSRPDHETKFLSEAEMQEMCFKPSQSWVEAGSGTIGQVKVEILSCEGLPNKDIGKFFGNKIDPLVSLIFEDVIVQTDVIQDCQNPIFLPWTQRAFLFNRMHPLSTLYIGVYNHNYGPFHHDNIGRIAIDIREFDPNTVYTMKYNLYNSSVITNRKEKGKITIRLQVTDNCAKANLLQLIHPPQVHVNVKRRKTLSIARHTLHGKYRAEVYNMKILRSYIDEFMEYLEMSSFEITLALNSLLFWKGQVAFFGFSIPLYSALVFLSAIFVIENVHLIPAYFFLILGSCMYLQMNRRSNHPSPWHRSHSFWHHLMQLLPFFSLNQKPGITIEKDEGHVEMLEREKERQKTLEEDKLLQAKISSVRQELNSILAALSDFSLQTTEMANAFNPLSKLLPLQLLLGEIILYLRMVKSVLSCDDSQISFVVAVSLFAIAAILSILPIGWILHWMSRIAIWVCLGPWMKIIHMRYVQNQVNQKKSEKQTTKVTELMKEIQEREQKVWMNVRMQQEEVLKLKAVRSMRFGRFSFKVPSLNITRYRDIPLSDSFAIPYKDEDSICVTRYIPGQKHYGTMIPEFTKSIELTESAKKARRQQLLKLKSTYNMSINNHEESIKQHGYNVDDLDDMESLDGMNEIPNAMCKKTVQVQPSLVFHPEEDQAQEEGFELVESSSLLIRKAKLDDCRDEVASPPHSVTCDYREDTDDDPFKEVVSEIIPSPSRDEIEVRIERVLSDITDTDDASFILRKECDLEL
jgi:hypothetical protein